MGHIELARWADCILIAPATAHTLARLAHGLADDLLTAMSLAATCPARGRAGDEPHDVEAPGHATQRPAIAQRRGADRRTRRRSPGMRRIRAGAHARTRVVVRANSTRLFGPRPLAGKARPDHGGTHARTHRPGAIHQQPQFRQTGLRHRGGGARRRCRCHADLRTRRAADTRRHHAYRRDDRATDARRRDAARSTRATSSSASRQSRTFAPRRARRTEDQEEVAGAVCRWNSFRTPTSSPRSRAAARAPSLSASPPKHRTRSQTRASSSCEKVST